MRSLERLLGPRSAAALMVLAGLVGVGVGVSAAVLIQLIALVQGVAGAVGSDRPWLFALVPAGLLASWAITQKLAPEAAGHGVPQVMASLLVRGGHMRSRGAPSKMVATALTIGAGGSAGREGPIAQIGGVIGSTVGRWLRLGEDHVRSLVAAGAGAGIAAAFNAPIAGMLFAMEILLTRFSVRHLNTVVVACVAAAVTARSLVGERLIFLVRPYSLQSPWELLAYAVLGTLAVVAGYLFLTMLDWWERAGERLRRFPDWAVIVAFGLVMALLGYLWPEVLGTGQRFVGSILQGEAAPAWWGLLGLAVVKIVATGVTFGARGSGGVFMPALFVGATLGGGFAELIAPYWGFSPLVPEAFALVGMAAVFSAIARAPLTSILIVFEITGDYRLVLPLMLATSLATVLSDRLRPESVYTGWLIRRDIRPLRTSEIDLLDTVSVGEVMSDNPAVITPDMTTRQVQELLDRHRLHGLPVVHGERLVGIIAITDILRTEGASDEVRAGAAMTPRPITVTPSTPVSVALERMAALGVGRIPVVRDDHAHYLVGMFRREDAVRAYHRALASGTDAQLARDRLRFRIEPGAQFFDFQVPAGSVADQRPLSEVPWPEGCTLVSVRRGREVLVPAGPTVLRRGDLVTAFGTPAARSRLMERLEASSQGDE